MSKEKTTRTTALDILIGNRLRQKRIMLGLSIKELAVVAGVSHQQYLKYERGINRTPVSRLNLLCQSLNEPIKFFIETNTDTNNGDFLNYKKEDLSIIKRLLLCFSKLENDIIKIKIIDLIKSIVDDQKKND